MMGFTTLFGFKPCLNDKKFKIVEQGIDNDNAKKIDKIGIAISVSFDNMDTWSKNNCSNMLEIPIRTAVTSESKYVANTFSIQDFLLNSPIIKSLDVLAIKGPLRLPLNDSKAGTIKIKTKKLSNGSIKSVKTIPARILPIMETVSEGKTSLTSLFESFLSMNYH